MEEFIPVGLSEQQVAALSGVAPPQGRGLLAHLIDHPEPLRVADIGDHPDATGFPPGHPPMRTLLRVALTGRERLYGNLCLCERRDGRPFDDHDQDILVALAGAAGLAAENARLHRQVHADAERFQRLLLPGLPDAAPFGLAAIYRPATTPKQVGGDWYEALMLPDGTCALVIGDVAGHDLESAAGMAQTRSMLAHRRGPRQQPHRPGPDRARHHSRGSPPPARRSRTGRPQPRHRTALLVLAHRTTRSRLPHCHRHHRRSPPAPQPAPRAAPAVTALGHRLLPDQPADLARSTRQARTPRSSIGLLPQTRLR
ncbi:PP2C family protein-serine/threonine phosphatase [Kitasatospora cineracea]|uniref:PP2C family protein-serine/threonine phosphatase n=1 Tax=Kitasatospora cineracea TaxID=88074 RepID=UPI00368D53DD